MERLQFAKVLLSSKGGDRQVELFATSSATVLDLRAKVGSDAVWLKNNEHELGELLEKEVVLRDIPNLETKILCIVQSCNRGDRHGDPTKVDVVSK